MLRRSTVRSIHLAGTIWFILCLAYLLGLTLRQAGVRWWVLFSLSGHGLLITFILVSLYLFAIFRGISSSQNIHLEHPLTSTDYYTVFYVTTPFLGGLAGCLSMPGVSANTLQFLLAVALGTLGATFLVWVIVDPLAGVLEVALSPTARRHRAERLAQLRAAKQHQRKQQRMLLEKVLKEEELKRQQWQELLKPEAEKLAELLAAGPSRFEQARQQAIDIGLNAWRIGGLSCMRQLHEMAMDLCKRKRGDAECVDYISFWWDGVGSWRNPSLSKTAGA